MGYFVYIYLSIYLSIYISISIYIYICTSVLHHIQERKGLIKSWKLQLNLSSFKWLETRRSILMSWIPIGLWQLETELGHGCKAYKLILLERYKILRRFRYDNNSRWKEGLFQKVMCSVEEEMLQIFFMVWKT